MIVFEWNAYSLQLVALSVRPCTLLAADRSRRERRSVQDHPRSSTPPRAMRLRCHTFVLLFFLNNVSALNILGIVSVPYRSHYMAFKAIFRELAKKGHFVTVLNHFPDEEPLKNLRFVDLQGNTTPNISKLEEYEDNYADFVHVHNYIHHLTRSPFTVNNDCEGLFTSVNAKAHLAENNKYDVILVEQFLSDCGLVYAATLFDAPIIGITSHVLLPWAYPRLGIPFDVSADAFYFTNAGPSPSLLAKVEAAVGHLLFTTAGRWYIQRTIYDSFRRHMSALSFDIERLAQERLKMMFSYQHYSVTGARLLAPQVLEIAGAHVSSPQPLPKVSYCIN